MSLLYLLPLSLCLSSLVAFGWGMARFFKRTSRPERRTAWVGLVGLLCAGWHVEAVASTRPVPWRSACAIALYVASLTIFFWAVRTCRRSRTTLTAIFDAQAGPILIQDGPFRLVRHPFYLAYVLFWIAGWVASSSWLSLGAVALMTTVYVMGALAEEAGFRGSPLARTYADYCQRTGFLLPRR